MLLRRIIEGLGFKMEQQNQSNDEGIVMDCFTLYVFNSFLVEYAPKSSSKQSNVLPLWGNERTMNLNPLILTNIQSSHYFKGM